MTTHAGQAISETYARALSDSLIIEQPAPGLLNLTGADRVDLLNRISTNALLDLKPGEFRRTILTNALARVVDLITLFNRADDLLVMTSPGREPDVRTWVQGYIFFRDDVQIAGAEPGLHHWGVYGPNAANVLLDLNLLPQDLDPKQYWMANDALVWQVANPKPGGFEMLLPEKAHTQLSVLAAQDPTHAVRHDVFEILRIETGVPRSGAEITQETIPLEVGLWDEVSFRKGCFTGQEILARMESRGQLARRLVLLGCERDIAPGMQVRLADRDAGRLTSTACSPRHGWIGLALLKASALSSAELVVGEDSIPARILDPLQSARTTKAG
jgi:aminomethyltransferase